MKEELYGKIIGHAKTVGLCAAGVDAIASLYIYINKAKDQNAVNKQLHAKIAELEAQLQSPKAS